MFSCGCSGLSAGAGGGVESSRLLASSAGTWCTFAVATGLLGCCGAVVGAVACGTSSVLAGVCAERRCRSLMHGPSAPTDRGFTPRPMRVPAGRRCFLACGRFHSVVVVFVFQILHTGRSRPFLRGETAARARRISCSGLQSAPVKVGEKCLFRSVRNLALPKLLPNFGCRIGQDRDRPAPL